MQGNIRFIRKGGRVIPIRIDSSKGIKDNVRGNKAVGKEIAAEAKDLYDSKASPKSRSIVKTAFGIAEHLTALGGGYVGAKYLTDQAHEAATAYKATADSNAKKYLGVGILGAGTSGLAAKSLLKTVHVHKGTIQLIKRSKNFKTAALAATISGAATSGIGAYGYFKARAHQKRAATALKLTSAAKDLLSGNLKINLNR